MRRSTRSSPRSKVGKGPVGGIGRAQGGGRNDLMLNEMHIEKQRPMRVQAQQLLRYETLQQRSIYLTRPTS